MGKVKTKPEYPPPMTFEQIWAILQETARRQEESTKKAAEWQEESAKKAAEWQEENAKWREEAAKREKETAKWREEAAKREEEAAQKAAKREEEAAQKRAKWLEEEDKKFTEWRKEVGKTIDDITRRQKENAKMISGLGGRYGEMVEYMVKPNLVAKFRELGFVFTKVYPETEIKDEKHNILAEVDLTLENGDKVMIVEVKSKPTITDIKDHIKRMDTVRLHADLHNDKRKYLGAVAGMVISDRAREFILTSGFYVIEPSGETFTITPPRGKPKEW